MKRREFLALSLTATAAIFAACGGGGGFSGSSGNGATKSSSLPIPPLLKGVNKNGVKHYNLIAKEAQHSFFDRVLTKTYALNEQSYLGPTLLLENGDEVSLNFTNNLKETITMHSHGMHVPAKMDGTSHQIIAPNSTWSARYKVNQKASTNWYHPHTMNKTAEQVYMGLAGLIIVEDSESKSLNIPKEYGVDDIPLILQDKNFSNNQISYNPSMREVMHGFVGDYFLANGVIEPSLRVSNKNIRFRILNASNSTVYKLAFGDNRSFKQIATDNSFLESPVTINSLTLSPAERAEIIVDLSSDLGKSLVLKELNHNKTFLTINVEKESNLTEVIPNVLTSLEKLSPNSAVNTRVFELNGRMGNFTINGKSMDMSVINEQVPLNQVEIWEVRNNMMMDHNFHIHATHFMLIERDGSYANIADNEKGYKDVVYVPANSSVKFIVKMEDYADATTPYMYHCHFLEHEDRGMMGQFVVV